MMLVTSSLGGASVTYTVRLPLRVGDGEGIGAGVGDGEGIGAGVGAGVGIGAGCPHATASRAIIPTIAINTYTLNLSISILLILSQLNYITKKLWIG